MSVQTQTAPAQTGTLGGHANTAPKRDEPRKQFPVIVLRGEKIEHPDTQIFNDKKKTLEDQRRGLEEEVNGITKEIQSKNTGKDEYHRKKDELRAQMDTYKKQIDDKEAQRKEIMDQLDQRQKDINEVAKNNKTTSKKSSMGVSYQSEEEIDRKITDISRMMQMTTLSLKDEKKFIGQITQLKKDKSKLRGTVDASISASGVNTKAPSDQLKETLQIIMKELSTMRDAKTQVTKKLNDLIAERKVANQPLQGLFEKKQELIDSKYIINSQLIKLREEFDEQRKRYQAAANERRKENEAKRIEGEKKRIKEQKLQRLESELENMDESDVQEEINKVTQMLVYVKKLAHNANTEETKEMDDDIENTGATTAEGEEEIVVPKKNRDEFYYAPTSKKKDKKPQRRHITKKKMALTHPLQALTDFKQLEVDAPLSTEDLQVCIEKLEQKLEIVHNQHKQSIADQQQKKEDIQKEIDSLKIEKDTE